MPYPAFLSRIDIPWFPLSNIDFRWALGVLLYEMLAGRSPFDVVGATDNPDQNTEDYLFQGEVANFREIENMESMSEGGSIVSKFLKWERDCKPLFFPSRRSISRLSSSPTSSPSSSPSPAILKYEGFNTYTYDRVLALLFDKIYSSNWGHIKGLNILLK